MKFKLDEKVIVNGHKGTIKNYSARYNDYDIKLDNGPSIVAKENEIALDKSSK